MTKKPDTSDVAVIGGGMAGLTAAIYCQRFKLATSVFAKEPGGIITEAAVVENWPGEKSVSGIDLMEKVRAQAEALGAAFIFDEVTSAKGNHGHFTLTASGGGAVTASALVLATGSQRRKLGVPGEKEFAGKGVSYCATCDAFFFRGRTVAVVGGSDSAAAAAVLLSNMARKVYVIYRRERLRAEPIRVERLENTPNVEIITNATIDKIVGSDTVTQVALTGGGNLPVDGVFVEIGFDPSTKISKQLGVDLDESGFIRVDEACRTSVAGVYAAGDVTTGANRMRQLVTAAAEGAIAAESAYEDIKQLTIQY
ncbi:MAG: FAD-dependent oxidoreductase [Planctomycetes bacterium]|nr:FAD-dependent oxidoreductase [Planctomycetota bacterium]